jgi:hypothetical protein
MWTLSSTSQTCRGASSGGVNIVLHLESYQLASVMQQGPCLVQQLGWVPKKHPLHWRCLGQPRVVLPQKPGISHHPTTGCQHWRVFPLVAEGFPWSGPKQAVCRTMEHLQQHKCFHPIFELWLTHAADCGLCLRSCPQLPLAHAPHHCCRRCCVTTCVLVVLAASRHRMSLMRHPCSPSL